MIQTIWMSLGKRLFVLLHLRGNKHFLTSSLDRFSYLGTSTKHFLTSCWYIQIPGHINQTICRSGMIVEEMLKQPNIRVSSLPHNCVTCQGAHHRVPRTSTPSVYTTGQWILTLIKKPRSVEQNPKNFKDIFFTLSIFLHLKNINIFCCMVLTICEYLGTFWIYSICLAKCIWIYK